MRTDHHAPGSDSFDPEKYEFVDCIDLNPEPESRSYYNQVSIEIRDRFLNNGYRYTGTRGRCVHCGIPIRYAAVMVREDSKEVVQIGEQCLENRFESQTKQSFRRMQKLSAELRSRRKVKQDIGDLCDRYPLLTELTYFPSPLFRDAENREIDNDFLWDVAEKLRKTGTLSEKQIAAAERCILGKVKFHDKVRESRERREAERDSLVSQGVSCPSGRVVVTGRVVSTKWVSSEYGDTLKLLVVDDSGFKVWMSAPRSVLSDVDRGSRISVKVSVEPSADDPLFGFGKRPSNASLIGD